MRRRNTAAVEIVSEPRTLGLDEFWLLIERIACQHDVSEIDRRSILLSMPHIMSLSRVGREVREMVRRSGKLLDSV